jgi:adenosylhomocysteinase
MRAHGVPVLAVEDAVRSGEWFLDVGAVLGRARRPRGAAEVTRTGVHHYRTIGCPVVSADDCRAKRIEGFFGTGDGFLRAWRQLRPDDPIAAKAVVQFGFGKIGRGVAHRLRTAGARVTVAEVDSAAQQRARLDGFAVVEGRPSAELDRMLASAEIVIAVTGIPGILSSSVPTAWLRRNRPVFVNLGAEDEFGPAFGDGEILGGRSLPLNFHLSRPTENRYVDAPLAAHVLAMEALLADPGAFEPGIHPLPPAMDAWILETWRAAWPDEDLRGIGEELGLS